MPARNSWIRAGLLAGVMAALPAGADLELGLPFGDGAVLQAGKGLPVWGKADPLAEVEVKIGSRSARTTAAADGRWRVEFPPAPASGVGVDLQVRSGRARVVREDVLFGEVWLASGQSNMRFMLKDCESGREAVAESGDGALRFLDFQGRLHPGGKRYEREFLLGLDAGNYYECEGWQRASAESSGEFSGVGYFFGQMLRKELAVPVGIIHLAVGGSPMEAHLPRSSFERNDILRPLLHEWWRNPDYPQWCRERAALNLAEWFRDPPEGRHPPHPFAPGFLWEAGVQPLLPFPIKGVIWYQGESNATRDGGSGPAVAKELNRRKFEALIRAWREAWTDPGLPVYFVQLPGLNRNWAPFREMQLEVSREVPATGMAVTIDVGHATNVHPRQKRPVGERLARLALARTYRRAVPCEGPALKDSVPQGSAIRFEFDQELRAADGGEVRGFEVAGADREFHPAEARISGNWLEVRSGKVAEPVAVRYAWANDPDGNLVNGHGLPASPFRTDQWPAPKPDERRR